MKHKSGLAAFTADALLFGTKNYTKKQIEETFDFLGASISSLRERKPLKLQYHLRKVILKSPPDIC